MERPKITKDFDVESHEPQAIGIVILNFYSISTPNFLYDYHYILS